MQKEPLIRYPRNRIVRAILRWVGRIFLAIFARPRLIGERNLPRKGPAILAGNHVAIMEVVMMAVYSKGLVEFLGTGDLPVDPKFAWLAKLYQFIPITRGSVDRVGIQSALGVLKQRGAIGIFPQGGIWDSAARQGRIGTALLSQLGEAPVVPIGFGGMEGALRDILRLKRPVLTMNVGEPILPVKNDPVNSSRRKGLDQNAELIMQRILDLIPEEERLAIDRKVNEAFGVEITIRGSQGRDTPVNLFSSPELSQAMGQFFHYPVLLDALKRNLKLPVGVLQNMDRYHPIEEIQAACKTVLNYLENKNPGFFTYRLGIDTGIHLKTALEELARFTPGADEQSFLIKIVPWYSYDNTITGKRDTLHGSQSMHSM